MSRKGSFETLDVWCAEDAVDMYNYIRKHVIEALPSVRVNSRSFTELPCAKPVPEEAATLPVVVISTDAVAYLADHPAANFLFVRMQPSKCSYLLWLEKESDSRAFCDVYADRFTAFSKWVALDFNTKESIQSSFRLLAELLRAPSLPDSDACTETGAPARPGGGGGRPKEGGDSSASGKRKDRGAFVVVPNQVMLGTPSATIVVDVGYSCTNPAAYLVHTRTKEKLELLLTPLSRPGVFTFDVPSDAAGKYQVHFYNSGKTLGSRSFTVLYMPPTFIYDLLNPLRVMSEALGVSNDRLDEHLSQSFTSYMPVDIADMQAAFAIDEKNPDGAGAPILDREVPTLLHFACKFNLRNLLSKLIDSPGALKTCFIKNKHGETPMDIAISSGNSEAAKMMESFQELACNLHDTYGILGLDPQEAEEYVQGDGAFPYSNTPSSAEWSKGQYIYSTQTQHTYVRMQGWPSKMSAVDLEECEYAEANAVGKESSGDRSDICETSDEYLAPSEVLQAAVSPQRKAPPQRPARLDALDWSRGPGCGITPNQPQAVTAHGGSASGAATLPRMSSLPAYPLSPKPRLDVMAMTDPVAVVRAGNHRTQFDEQSKQLQISVKNGELSQADAVKVFDDLSRRYKSIKGKSFSEKMVEFEELKKSGNQSQSVLQKMHTQLNKVLPNRWQAAESSSPVSKLAAGLSLTGATLATAVNATSIHGSRAGLPFPGGAQPVSDAAGSAWSRSGSEQSTAGEGASGSSGDDSDAADSVDEPPPIPLRKQLGRPTVYPRHPPK